MNTKILEYMVAVAREGSVSKAAEEFYLSQPVLSRHIKKIEEELGTPLFVRKRSGLVLTDAGRIYISSAKMILHLESELENELREMKERMDNNEKNTDSHAV